MLIIPARFSTVPVGERLMMPDWKTLLGGAVPPLVGLDISSSGVRLVELANAGKEGIRLERCAAEPLPRGAVADGNIENLDQVVDAVRRLLKKSGTRARHVALGMPPAAVITKKIVLPAGLSEEQLEVQAESEASQYIPFALDDVSLDFDIIGPVANSQDDIEVMLAAARREKIEDRVAVAEASGLKASVMDIESYAARAAVTRAASQVPGTAAGQVIALFQVGASMTHVSVLVDGSTVWESEKAFGGNSLTQDIVRAYGLAFEEAEARKKTWSLQAGDAPANYGSDVLQPFLESAALEVTRAIQFFFTSTPYTKIDRIFLAGGCAMLPGLPEIVAGRTRIESAVISPFQGMALAPGVREQQLRGDGPAYLVACGLALRRFD
jgi:type IV pilus assembly protein PilM